MRWAEWSAELWQGAWWLHLPHDIPRFAPVVDFEVVSLGALLIAHQDRWVRAQRWWDLPECGTFFMGGPQYFLRAAYLLNRAGFVVEWGEPDRRLNYGVAADLDDMQRLVRMALFEPDAFSRLPWVERDDPFNDEEVERVWKRAYERLLGLPAPPARPVGPLTIEQQRNDTMRRNNLIPHVRLLGTLRSTLDLRLLRLQARRTR